MALRDSVMQRASRRAHSEVLTIVSMYVLYAVARLLIDGDEGAARRHGEALLDIERSLGFAIEATTNHWLAGQFALAVLASYLYVSAHYVVTLLVLVWLWHYHRDRYSAGRNALLATSVLGLIVFTVLPTAPPRLLLGGEFIDILTLTSHWGWWSDAASAPRGMAGLTNQYAAFPSLHVGWAVWCAAQLLAGLPRERRGLRALAVAYPVIVSVIVVATGNHYILDVVAGVLVAVAGLLAAPAIGVALVQVRRWLGSTQPRDLTVGQSD